MEDVPSDLTLDFAEDISGAATTLNVAVQCNDSTMFANRAFYLSHHKAAHRQLRR
jgi:hypothetical protein